MIELGPLELTCGHIRKTRKLELLRRACALKACGELSVSLIRPIAAGRKIAIDGHRKLIISGAKG